MKGIPSPFIDDLIRLALREDIAYGDITTSLLFSGEELAKAVIVAKQDLVVCGIPTTERVCRIAEADISLTVMVQEGMEVPNGSIIAELAGSAAQILSLERIILNFLQRLSGIATTVREITKENPSFRLLDTRKTTPGWRVLEKYAVAMGGGTNHRLGLSDMIMVKDNHLDLHGVDTPERARAFFAKLRARKPWHTPIECEVRSRDELALILEGRPDFILLDNMDDEQVASCMALVAEADYKPTVEVSGQVTAERIPELSKRGVQYASLGRLTSCVESVDISMSVSTGA